MRAKRLLQMASLGVLTGLLVSPVLAQNSPAPPPEAGPGFGFGNEALQPSKKALGAAGKAIDDAAGHITGKTATAPNSPMAQSPASKPQTPMAKAEPAFEDNAPYTADDSASPLSQPTPNSERMAKAEPGFDDADSSRSAGVNAGASDEFGPPAGATNPSGAMLDRSPAWGVKPDHMAKAEPLPEDPYASRGPDGAESYDSASMAGAAVTPAPASPTTRSATGQALGAAGQAIGGTAGKAVEGVGKALGPAQPAPGATMGSAPRY